MPWNTVSSLASCMWSSARFTVQITRSPLINSSNPSCASLESCLLYKLSIVSGSQHPCLTPLPILTYLFPAETLTPRDLNGGIVTSRFFCTQRKHPTCVCVCVCVCFFFFFGKRDCLRKVIML